MEKKNLLYRIVMALLPVFSIVIFISLWLWISLPETSRIASPVDVWERFILFLEIPVSRIPIQDHIWISVQRVLIGLGISIVLGVIYGMLLALWPTFHSIFMPLFNMFKPIPPIAWIPLVTIWMGVGELPKIFLLIYGCVVPIALNTYTGISLVPKLYNDVGRIFHAGLFHKLTDIIFPSAIPAIIAGIKAALSSAWMILLSSEMISAKKGLGFLITRGSDSNDIALSMIAMIIIGLIGCLMSLLLTYLERKLCPWKTEIN